MVARRSQRPRRRSRPPAPPRRRPWQQGILWGALLAQSTALVGLLAARAPGAAPAPPAREAHLVRAAERYASIGRDAFHAWRLARRAGRQASAAALRDVARRSLSSGLNVLHQLLEPHASADASRPPSYDHREVLMEELASYLIDLEQAGPP